MGRKSKKVQNLKNSRAQGTRMINSTVSDIFSWK